MLEFVGRELYQSYFRIACDIIENKGDLENASRYLLHCKDISKVIGIKDNQVVSMKLKEIKKIRGKKTEEKCLKEAKNCLKVGDIYMQSGRLEDAIG